ncbi:uncharacterized protein LOC124165659 isoform X2 [Ischnura elegans]|uniref:uncharacterized protein LOC124165659 isoform X2 n=1 Tax=Ischnura elegans TaxID=197161 RepID=UPI001ED86CBB|nr:uncharacterized protein LOC124165659 isoform X2 [Ischnura elegans]
MPFLTWIFVLLFISGISGVPANNNFEQEDSDETIGHRYAAGEWHLKKFVPTMENSKLEYPQMDKSGRVRISEKTKADPDPIYFSDKRGRLGILSEDRRTVTRVDVDTEDKLYALAYTARPIKVGELFEITIEEDDPFRKLNNLCFGMTAINPDTLPQVPIVPLNIRAPGWYFIDRSGVQCDTIGCHGNGFLLPRNVTVKDTLGAIRKVPDEITFFFNKEQIATVQIIPPEDNLYGVADLQAFRKLSITS